MSDCIVQARSVVRLYEAGRVRALDGIDFDIERGEFVAVCGPSGCGKSTLLNVLSGIDRPDSGTMQVGGVSPPDLGPAELDRFRASTVGLVFQLHNLLPNLTALENIQVPMLGTTRTPADRLSRSIELLDAVGLTERSAALPTTLSGGERQRVAVARALANGPQVVLADEPTGALDSKTGARLLELLVDVRRQQGTTLIIVTHDISVAERADRIVHMLDGRIAECSFNDV
jgi:putative ABC transport system ATP-binding protein